MHKIKSEKFHTKPDAIAEDPTECQSATPISIEYRPTQLNINILQDSQQDYHPNYPP